MKKYLLILSVLVMGLASCSKNDSTPQPPFDAAAQAKIDDDAIKAYLVAHPTITALKDLNHPELYYQVIREGSGAPLTENSQLVISYTGTNLKDVTFDSSDNYSFKLSQDLIAGL
jgi:FKBP-type peptidyl-prolyl cis-trans isomerase FkpA